MRIAYSNGDGTWQQLLTASPGSYQHSLQAVYLNGDQYVDVIAQQWDFNFINIFINSGSRTGAWTYSRVDVSTSRMPPIVINVDGGLGVDIVTRGRHLATWYIYRSSHASNAQYNAPVSESYNHDGGNTNVESSGTLDFDSDGKMDVVTADRSRYVAVYRNEYGEGNSRYFSLNPVQITQIPVDIGFIDIGDINSDGFDDIVIGGFGAGYIICNGDGTWEPYQALVGPSVNHNYGGLKIFDIDG